MGQGRAEEVPTASQWGPGVLILAQSWGAAAFLLGVLVRGAPILPQFPHLETPDPWYYCQVKWVVTNTVLSAGYTVVNTLAHVSALLELTL